MESEVDNVLLNNSSYELIEAENLGKNFNIQWILVNKMAWENGH
jgi:hypothetical protein